MKPNTPSSETVNSELSADDKIKNLEKRLQDNRNAYLQSSQEVAANKKLIEALTKELKKSVTGLGDLSQDERDKLNELKITDPDKYIAEVTSMKDKAAENLDTTLTQAKKEAQQEADNIVISEFIKDNPHVTLDNLQEDVPYRLRKKFDNGEIDIKEFLGEAGKLFKKKVKDAEILNQPDLHNLSGDSKVSKEADKIKQATDYANAIF